MIDLPVIRSFFDIPQTLPFLTLFAELSWPWKALDKLSSLFEEYPLGSCLGEVAEGAHLIHPEQIFIGKGARVEAGAYLVGPCILEEGVTVRHGAYIRGQVVVGRGAIVGHGTEIKRSILFPRAKAPHFNYVGDSILGACNLGAGATCANRRLDGGEIVIRVQEEEIPTGMRKLGAILGDGVEVGCNAVLNPGTLIERNGIAYPCRTYGGLVLSTSKITKEEEQNLLLPS